MAQSALGFRTPGQQRRAVGSRLRYGVVAMRDAPFSIVAESDHGKHGVGCFRSLIAVSPQSGDVHRFDFCIGDEACLDDRPDNVHDTAVGKVGSDLFEYCSNIFWRPDNPGPFGGFYGLWKKEAVLDAIKPTVDQSETCPVQQVLCNVLGNQVFKTACHGASSGTNTRRAMRRGCQSSMRHRIACLPLFFKMKSSTPLPWWRSVASR